MKISIFGQREIKDEAVIREGLFQLLEKVEDIGSIIFLHGGAKGPQEVACGLFNPSQIVVFKPWTLISKRLAKQVSEAGKFDPVYFFFRNIQIVDNSDLVVIFDNGTQDAEVYKVISLCKKKEKPYQIIKV